MICAENGLSDVFGNFFEPLDKHIAFTADFQRSEEEREEAHNYLKGCSFIDTDLEGNNVCHIAATRGHENVILQILEMERRHGIKSDMVEFLNVKKALSMKNSQGHDPIACAALKGHGHLASIMRNRLSSQEAHDAHHVVAALERSRASQRGQPMDVGEQRQLVNAAPPEKRKKQGCCGMG